MSAATFLTAPPSPPPTTIDPKMSCSDHPRYDGWSTEANSEIPMRWDLLVAPLIEDQVSQELLFKSPVTAALSQPGQG